MSNVHELSTRPDSEAMREALYALFRHAMRGCVELGWTDRNGALNRAKQYDVGDLDDLVAFAARINENPNCNTYISAGLRRPDIDRDHRANDADVETVAALKVDCDTPGCLEAALKTLIAAGMAPSLAFFTGKHPHPRGSLWWVLDEPEPDLARVRKLETALAYWLNSDPKVINPSRVMRLPGSVAWPIKAGRVVEMTGAVTDAQTRSAPYTIDEIEHHLRRAGRNTESPGTHTGAYNTGAAVLDFSAAAKTLELSDLLTAAREPHRWHQSALQATAHLIGRGTPPDVTVDLLTPMLTLPGYVQSQTREELTVMVKGAVQKGWAPLTPPPPQTTTESPQAPQAPQGAPARDPFPLIPLADMGLQEPPEWRIDGILPQRGFGVLYGASGTFKSFNALDMALAVAHGADWRNKVTQQCGVAYIAGEGTYGIQNRVMAWKEAKQPAAEGAFWLAPVAANLLDVPTIKLVAERLQPLDVKFVVVDTLARSFGGGDENSAQDMGKFVAACDYIGHYLNAFVLAVHHSGKDETKGARGSGALRAAADVEMSLQRGIGEMSAILTMTKLKDAEDGQRIRIRMVKVEATHAASGEVISSLVPVMDDDPGAAVPAKNPLKLGRRERIVLDVLREAHPLRFGQIKAQTGFDGGSLSRILRSLFDKNLVSQDEELWMPARGTNENEQKQYDAD